MTFERRQPSVAEVADLYIDSKKAEVENNFSKGRVLRMLFEERKRILIKGNGGGDREEALNDLIMSRMNEVELDVDPPPPRENEVEPDMDPPSPPRDSTSLPPHCRCRVPAIEITRDDLLSTPAGALRNVSAGVDWRDDTLSAQKAYVLACYSELAYSVLLGHEMGGRVSLFCEPYVAQARRLGVSLDVARALSDTMDIRVEVIVTGPFVYLIAGMGDVVIVAVRGTRGLPDWGINFDASKVGGFHFGFSEEAERVAPLVKGALYNVGSRGKPIYFTGHSMGGAVAVILSQASWASSAVGRPYTYAAPRFASAAAQSALVRKPYAFCDPMDIVPHVPPRFLGYSGDALTIRSWRVRDLLVPHFFGWHAMAHHRAVLGERVGEWYPKSAYIDLLRRLQLRQKVRAGTHLLPC